MDLITAAHALGAMHAEVDALIGTDEMRLDAAQRWTNPVDAAYHDGYHSNADWEFDHLFN